MTVWMVKGNLEPWLLVGKAESGVHCQEARKIRLSQLLLGRYKARTLANLYSNWVH